MSKVTYMKDYLKKLISDDENLAYQCKLEISVSENKDPVTFDFSFIDDKRGLKVEVSLYINEILSVKSFVDSVQHYTDDVTLQIMREGVGIIHLEGDSDSLCIYPSDYSDMRSILPRESILKLKEYLENA